MAATARAPKFYGTWKLNEGASRYSSVKPSHTVSITPEREVHLHQGGSGGNAVHMTYKGPEDRPEKHSGPLSGLSNAHLATTHSGEHSVEHTWKVGSDETKAQASVTPDGKKMTYTVHSVNGKPVNETLVYDKA